MDVPNRVVVIDHGWPPPDIENSASALMRKAALLWSQEALDPRKFMIAS